jgi:ceramide glucosyltransferase
VTLSKLLTHFPHAESFRFLTCPSKIDVTYVVDADDLATRVALQSAGLKVIVSRKHGEVCSGKISAQLTGLEESVSEAIVFADSDIIVERDWLLRLVSPLDSFDALTTFSWPVPLRRTFINYIRAGFWILGYDTHTSALGFLWGGSMAFRRETLDSKFIDYISSKIYDDVNITRYLKDNGKKIGFSGNAICLNTYDNEKIYGWASRQEMLVRSFSPHVAIGFFLFILGMIGTATYGVLIGNYYFLSIMFLWWLKGAVTSARIKHFSVLIPAVSLLSSVFALIILITTMGNKTAIWRIHSYKI